MLFKEIVGNLNTKKQPLSEKDILKLEVQEFMRLVRKEGTQARVEHMLAKGKPLRN